MNHPALRRVVFLFPERVNLKKPRAPILRKFSDKQTSLNAALALSIPRLLNCLKPSTFFIQPLGGSAIHLHLRQSFLPLPVCNLASMATVCR